MSFQTDEEWHLFYCDSTLGFRVIQDFHFRKLDDLMTQNDLKSQKMPYHSLKTFLQRTETVHSCYSHHKVS